MLRTSARPLSTTLGGTCCSPSALRRRLSTTTSLVNEVAITATKGASAITMTVISAEEGVNWLRSMAGRPSCGRGSVRPHQLDVEHPARAPGHEPARREAQGGAAVRAMAVQAGLRSDAGELLALVPSGQPVGCEGTRHREPQLTGRTGVVRSRGDACALCSA